MSSSQKDRYQTLLPIIDVAEHVQVDWKLLDELSICAYYQGDYQAANRAYYLCLKQKNVIPLSEWNRIRSNQSCFTYNIDSYKDLCSEIDQVATTFEAKSHSHMQAGCVPSVCHFVFLNGGDSYPFMLHHYLAIKSASSKMGWKHILIYNDQTPTNNIWWTAMLHLPGVQVITITPPTYLNNTTVVYKQHQADIIRLVALFRMGGVYMDLDMLTYNNFNHELAKLDATITVVLCKESEDRYSNAMIGCVKHSPFVKSWLQTYEQEYGQAQHDAWGGLSVVMPFKLSQQFPCLILPTPTFLPFDYMTTDFFTKTTTENASSIHLSSSTYGVHLWDTEQQKRNVLPKTIAAFQSQKSMFTECFEEEMKLMMQAYPNA